MPRLALLTFLGLVACSSPELDGTTSDSFRADRLPPSRSKDAAASAEPTADAGVAIAADDDEPIPNPVIPAAQGGVADPGVMRDVDGRYYMVSTGGSAGIYPIRVSGDLVRWQHVGYVFPRGSEPSWYDGAPWAPELHRVGARYVVFFTAKSKTTGKMALGVATSDAPTGPFVDRGKPILAESPIGAIDSHYFRDPNDGRHYMLWKQESNGLPPAGTPLFLQELAADGLSLVGKRVELLRNDLPWEANLVEGAWMIARDGWYYLFYSGNAFFDHRYATGVARSRSPRGPFEKHGAPILASTADDCWQGPGHGSIVEGPDGADWYVFHAWEKGRVGGGSPRLGLADRVTWKDGWPSINDGRPSPGSCGAR
ncbi:MAG: family 43 glycosylhydrolase [Labilithrix sp.]|nr:family 43 glycosylhydrolase [Labilithrix sp.]MCW5809626.1 family 43 glycosylhydrolase [Labilithrix sp.]